MGLDVQSLAQVATTQAISTVAAFYMLKLLNTAHGDRKRKGVIATARDGVVKFGRWLKKIWEDIDRTE